jgi:hypothetical protein
MVKSRRLRHHKAAEGTCENQCANKLQFKKEKDDLDA